MKDQIFGGGPAKACKTLLSNFKMSAVKTNATGSSTRTSGNALSGATPVPQPPTRKPSRFSAK